MRESGIWYADGRPATLEGSPIVVWYKPPPDPGWVSVSSGSYVRHRPNCLYVYSARYGGARRVRPIHPNAVEQHRPCARCARGLWERYRATKD